MSAAPLVLMVLLQPIENFRDMVELKDDLERQGMQVLHACRDDAAAVNEMFSYTLQHYERLLCMVSTSYAAWAFDNTISTYFPRPIVAVLYDNPSLYPYQWKPGQNVVFAASESRRSYVRLLMSPTFDTIDTQTHADPLVLTPPAPLSYEDYLAKRPHVSCAMNMRIATLSFEQFGDTIRGFPPYLRKLADAVIEEALTGTDERPVHSVLLDIQDRLGLALTAQEIRDALFVVKSYIKLWRRWHVYHLLSREPKLPVLFRGFSYPEYDLRARPGLFAGFANYSAMVDDIHQARISLSVTLPMPELLCERVQMALHSSTLAVANENPRVRELLNPGRDIVTYRFDDDLADKLRYYLDHPREAFAMVEAGRQNLSSGPLRQALAQRLSDGLLEYFANDLARLGWSPAA